MNPRILKIETLIIDLPTIRPHHLSMTVINRQSMVITRIYSEDGIVGIGESTTIGGLAYGPESPEGIKVTIDKYIAPLLSGKDATNINSLMTLIATHVKGNEFAKAGVETALMDAQGKRWNVSISELLGGSVCTHLEVLWTLASGDTHKDIEEAQTLIADNRHKTFKLKIGKQDPKKDVENVSAIKNALGPDVRITVDVNQAWEEEVAKKWINVLQHNGIDLIEQPVLKTNFDGLARLTEYFHVPIMADESCATITDAMKLAKIRGGSVFALKLMKAGGMNQALKIAGIAESAGISLYGGTMLEGTIGTAASVHAFSTLPDLSWGTELFGPLLLTDDIVVNPLNYSNSSVEVPKGPGLGIELDEDKVNFYTRRDTINVTV